MKNAILTITINGSQNICHLTESSIIQIDHQEDRTIIEVTGQRERPTSTFEVGAAHVVWMQFTVEREGFIL